MKLDSAEVKDLYAQHSRRMLRRAGDYLRDPKEAEDAVHETFARALEKINPSRIDNVPAYLSTILNNLLADYSERNKRQQLLLQSQERPIASADLGERLEREERRHQVRQAMNSLKPRQHRVLTLLSEGLTVGQIAGTLSMSSHNTSALLLRAKANLKRELLRRGLIPAIGPLVWMKRLRSRASVAFRNLPEELGAYLGAFQAAVLMGSLFVASLPTQVENYPTSRASFIGTFRAADFPRERIVELRPRELVRAVGRPSDPESNRVSPAVASIDFRATHVSISGDGRTGPSEPSLQDQLIDLVNHPENIPLPSCEGVVNCPQG